MIRHIQVHRDVARIVSKICDLRHRASKGRRRHEQLGRCWQKGNDEGEDGSNSGHCGMPPYDKGSLVSYALFLMVLPGILRPWISAIDADITQASPSPMPRECLRFGSMIGVGVEKGEPDPRSGSPKVPRLDFASTKGRLENRFAHSPGARLASVLALSLRVLGRGSSRQSYGPTQLTSPIGLLHWDVSALKPCRLLPPSESGAKSYGPTVAPESPGKLLKLTESM